MVERPEPVPGRGQVRIEVLRCGICGSDLHARHGIDQWAELAVQLGYDRFARSDQPIVFGHEFCGEVAEHGPGCRKSIAGRHARRRAAAPARRAAASTRPACRCTPPAPTPSRCSSQESLMMPVPNGLDPDVAALTEPMAVGWHAVRRGEVGKRDRRDRDRLRPGRAGGDPAAEGEGRAHRRRQRLLARAPGAGDARAAPTSSSTRRTTLRTTAVRPGAGISSDIPAALELAVDTTREARAAAGRLVARCGASARRSAPRPSTR